MTWQASPCGHAAPRADVTVLQCSNDVPTPEISVVIPVGSLDSYATKAIDSILQQRGVEFELIVIFDGIDPRSLRRKLRVPMVTLLASERRRGVAASLNSALPHVKADLVARMDADDISHPYRLRRQVDYLRAHPRVAVVGAGADIIDGRGVVRGRISRDLSPDQVRHGLLSSNPLIHPSVAYRLAPVLRQGGYRQEADGVEDYDLWLALACDYDLAVMPDVVLSYRRHEGQATSSKCVTPSNELRLFKRKLSLARRMGRNSWWVLGNHWAVAVARRARGLVNRARFQ